MAPGAHVVTGRDALASRDGQMDAARHVVGGHVPAVGDELPVQLTSVGPGVHHVCHGVGDADSGPLVFVRRVDLHARVGRVLRDLVRPRRALVALRELPSAAREVLDGKGRDLRILVARRQGGAARGDIPVHAVERAVKVKRAVLDDTDRSVRVHGEVDVHGIDGVLASLGRARGQGKQQRHHGGKRDKGEAPGDSGTGSVHGTPLNVPIRTDMVPERLGVFGARLGG